MVKAQEIRIGNYFKTEIGLIGKVLSFHESKVTMKMPHSTSVIHTKPQFRPGLDIDPIPLTPEILEKAGWEKFAGVFSKNEWALREDAPGYEFNSPYWRTGGISVQYVHQLQNLYFALTGQELEIKM